MELKNIEKLDKLTKEIRGMALEIYEKKGNITLAEAEVEVLSELFALLNVSYARVWRK